MNFRILILMSMFLFPMQSARADLSTDLLELQHHWAKTNYATPEAQQERAFEELAEQARQIELAYPERAEPKVWLAIILSSDAGATGGFGALGKVKEARAYLEKAEKIDSKTLNGSIYTSLGSLYYQVPGWPIGFGSEKKAERYLKMALDQNPEGIDPNYFYGDFMLEQGKIEQAISYLEKAQAAPPRSDRPLADKGRQQEIAEKLAIAREKL